MKTITQTINLQFEINSAIQTWLDKTTNLSLERAADMQHDKRKAVDSFFAFIQKTPEKVTPEDVRDWRISLSQKGLKEGTIYNRIGYLSSFYEFLRNNAELAQFLPFNPARIALPKAPKPFQSKSVKSLSDEELKNLLKVIEKEAESKKLINLRDYAIFSFFLITGMRRNEILSLNGNSFEQKDGRFFIVGKVKGGNLVRREINDQETIKLFFEYLEKAKLKSHLGTAKPIWLQFHNGAKQSKNLKLSTHAFSNRMKKYAEAAGIKDFHLHRLRHTYARIVSETAESLTETQEALGHSNLQTTKLYVQTLGIKKDKFSSAIRDRLL
jgi:integrase